VNIYRATVNSLLLHGKCIILEKCEDING